MNYTDLKNNDVYIFGYGALGRKVYKILNEYDIKCLGYIDNHKNNLLKLQDIQNKEAIILVASINYMYEIYQQCVNAGFKNFLLFPDLIKMFPELEAFNDAFNGLFTDYAKNRTKYDNLYKLFTDKKSLEVLDGIIEFRKTTDYTIFNRIKSDSEEQYFNNLIPIEQVGVLVDGGAYIGDSAESFIKFNPHYKKIYCFEPDEQNYDLMCRNLNKYSNIKYYKNGLSDKPKQAFFSNDNTGSKIIENAPNIIECVALDDIVTENKVMIKLDIEGAEPEALNGAQRLIKNSSVLAICVYHKPEHLYTIPEQIKKINPNYHFYLRHYTNTIFETVLYAIPLERNN